MGINYQVMPGVPAFTPSEVVPTQSRPQTGPLQPQTVGFEIESAPEPEPDLESFAALLQGGTVPNLPNQDLDSFWNSLAEAGEIKPANPDMISYDQARQLGLAPGEEEH
jgi:hypothetical protein